MAVARDSRLRQECLAGIIELKIDMAPERNRISLQVPQPKISVLQEPCAQRLIRSLGVRGDAAPTALRVDVGVVWLVADLGASDAVAMLDPDLDQVHSLSADTHAAGITVFGRARDGDARLHVRSFAPILGVPEDPVCGSGNASVAAYLLHTGLIREIGSEYLARQGIAVGRAGAVTVQVRENEIHIGGFAVTCIDGALVVP